ncbi:MAG: tripartite tricarboxylate transporter permease [Thermoplasmatota archaeon]
MWAELLGAAAGFASALVPGFHVNGLAEAATLAAPRAPAIALGLVAALAASVFGASVAAIFLGAPAPEAVASALPGHAMLFEGRGAEAVHLATLGAFFGLVAGLALAAPLAFVLGPPLDGAARLAPAMAWLVLALCALLVLTERRRIAYRARWVVDPWGQPFEGDVLAVDGPTILLADGRTLVDDLGLLPPRSAGEHVATRASLVFEHGPLSRALGKLAAFAVFAASGALGLVALRIGVKPLVAWPSSALLPMLAGLFGAPGLLLAARSGLRVPPQAAESVARASPSRSARAVAMGTLGGVGAALLPGFTPGAAAAAAFAFRPSASREETLLVLGAAAGAEVSFSLLAFLALGHARSGALVAAALFDAHPDPIACGVAALIGALLGYLASRWTARHLADLAPRLPPRAFALSLVALLATTVFVFAGPLGVVEFVVACAVGLVPWVLGLRRSLSMGAILVPTLARLFGFG